MDPREFEQERRARQALVTRGTDAVVALIFDAPGTETTDWGSGTLLLTRSGSAAVLTVAHIFDGRAPGALPMQLMVEGFGHPIPNAVERIVPGPHRVDVALALLRSEVGRAASVCQVALDEARVPGRPQ